MYNNGNTSKNVTGASVVDGTIANADIDDSAAIAQSKLATLVITDSEVADNELSGNKIDGGTISNFTSTGIDDNASAEKVDITDSIVDVLTGANLRAVDGILFGSDTAAANTLDDYEEGTFTPSARSGNTGSGVYTKIGNAVHFKLNISSIASTGTTLEMLVSSLPFTSANDSLDASVAIGSMYKINSPVATMNLRAKVGANTSNIAFYWSQDDAVYSIAQCQDFDDASAFILISGTYQV